MSAAAIVGAAPAPHFVLSALEIKALAAFTSSDATRPQLCCIHFDAPAGRVVATDGPTLVMRSGPVVEGRAFNVTPKRLRELDGFPITAADADALTAPDAPQFPPCMEIVPVTPYAKRAPSVGLNCFYLERLALVAKAAGWKLKGKAQKPNALVSIGGKLKPVKFEVQAVSREITWTVIIMPVRL